MNFLPATSDTLAFLILTCIVIVGLAIGLHYHSASATAAMVAAISALVSKYLQNPGTGLAAAAGGAVPQRADVYPWRTWPVVKPLWQLQQTLPTGVETATWYNDCGETCAAMLLRACRGVDVPPDVLRLQVLGQPSSGLTTAQNLIDVLALNSVAAAHMVGVGDDALAKLRSATQDGRPCICLGTWPTPGGVLHWILALYLDKDDTVHYINPWGGARSYLSWLDWQKYSTGDYVELRSHLLFG